MNITWWRLPCYAAVAGLIGCTTPPLEPTTASDYDSDSEVSRIDTPAESGAGSAEPAAAALQPTIFMGTDQPVAVPAPRPKIALDGEAVMLNFEQAPLNEIIHTILGDTLGLDYVVENAVPGKITLRTRSPIPRDELLPILEALLRNNNVLMIRGPNDRFFISASPSIQTVVPSYQSEPTEGYSNVIVPLQYISAPEMAEILRPVATDTAFVRIDPKRNLLILAGTQLQLQGWLEIVGTFDIDQLAGMSVGFFPLNNSTVSEVFTELEVILKGVGGQGDESGLSSMVKVMPIDRLNAILVLSPRSHYIDTVSNWITELDTIEDVGAEPILNVYPVRNGDAAHLASLLSTIYGGSGGGGSTSREGVAPGTTRAQSGSGNTGTTNRGNTGGGAGSFTLEGDVKVVADRFNNSLLVYSAPFEYQKIERILTKLDVVATQVLIEASIIEVTLTDGLEYGLEWTFSNNLGGGDTGTGLLNLGGNLNPQAGFSYTVTNSSEAVKAVVNALAEKSLINVISTPSVLVLDNHTANIHVGDQQPIQSQSTVTNGGNVQNSITYRDTGVKLSVTPSVNDGGLVTLDISQSVTDVGPVDVATKQRTFLERNVESRVAVRSNESIVLGGLIRDNETTGRSGVPLLMDIPVVGGLFSSTSTASTRTELLIFITPRVLESDQDLKDLNIEMRDRMRGLTNFDDLPVSFADEDQAP